VRDAKSPVQPAKRNLTAPACSVVVTCGALVMAQQLPGQRTPREEAIAALAQVGGVLSYDKLNRPVTLAFTKAEREVDDAALAYVAQLDTLDEITFSPMGFARTKPLRRALVTDKGLAHLRGLAGLRVLNLARTGVRGPGLAQLHGNKKLERLDLSQLPLGDEGLKYLAGFDSLTHLQLADNGITDKGFAHLAGLPNLRELWLLGRNDITGKGLAHLAGLANLRSLWLTCRSISPEGLGYLAHMTYLNELTLNIPELAHIEFLRNFVGLTQLSLEGTSIADADLANIAGLNKLRDLNLGDTQIGDGALRHLAGLSNLLVLDLSDTRVTDASVNQLRTLSQCQQLSLMGTAVTADGAAKLSARYPAMRILR
jgi:internalin A